jgi:hypothetical protein
MATPPDSEISNPLRSRAMTLEPFMEMPLYALIPNHFRGFATYRKNLRRRARAAFASAAARARSSTRRIFPDTFLGSSPTNTICRPT